MDKATMITITKNNKTARMSTYNNLAHPGYVLEFFENGRLVSTTIVDDFATGHNILKEYLEESFSPTPRTLLIE
jgi:antitoxin component YwqK of YwqJK toxin-antitoxin module